MISFEKFELKNGLKVLLHEDPATPMAVVNLLYRVGAKNENPEKTGFAHLFEHLMFGGSANCSSFDGPILQAGGESNAFTNNDFTNYYNVLPANNLETALWLESDRMAHLTLSEKRLDIQKKVVSEEFRENYLNQPYGDIWHYISDLSYNVHPYKWPTIGKELSHIDKIKLADAIDFKERFYHPANAILVVAGKIDKEQVKTLVEQWFSDIPGGEKQTRFWPDEPEQTAQRRNTVEAKVPVSAIYKSYHVSGRASDEYYLAELLSDILASGNSSRFQKELVREKGLFSEIDAYLTGMIDNGLLVIEGKLAEGVEIEKADEAIEDLLDRFLKEPVTKNELQKVVNKTESYLRFSRLNLLNKTISLAFFEHLGDARNINNEISRYQAFDEIGLQDFSRKVLRKENCSTLMYQRKNGN